MSDSDFLWGFVVPLIVLGFAAGAAVFVGLPWLWSLLKPLLRQALGA